MNKAFKDLAGGIASLICVGTLHAGTSSPEIASVPSESSDQPNILLVVADDLGMFDIGAYGSEIKTPSIDRLAAQGLVFTDFHTSATCSPTRSMLLTGTDSHAAGIGNMIEHVAPNQRDQRGYEGHLTDRAVTVASLLNDAGYRTFVSGKWHLGKTEELLPINRGFEKSFVLLEGGASYFNDMMGLNAIVPEASYRHNREIVEELPEDFYATEYFVDYLLDQLRMDDTGRPFFGYLAFSAPHWPLQVKDEHVDLYAGRYDQGYEALLDSRMELAKAAGTIPADTVPADWPSHVIPWSQLSPEQQRVESRTMEVYSAVVERMDYHLGRVLDYLEETGELGNTLVIFMSDNGPDGSDRSKLPGNDWWLPEAWDLSYENMGRIASYVYPGPAWARTSAGPLSMYKEFLSQGGIQVPLIISYPEHRDSSRVIRNFTHVMDIAPTILEFAGVEHPGTDYQGSEIAPMEGHSLSVYIDEDVVEAKDRYVGWELFGQRAIRKGDWKLLWLTSKPRWLVKPENADQWRLYNLAEDPGETNNLIEQEPEKFAELLEHWEEYAEQQSVILPEWDY